MQVENNFQIGNLKSWLKVRAAHLGFERSGIAVVANELKRDARFEGGSTAAQLWIDRGWNADMEYLRRHLPKKQSPEHLLPGVRSVFMVACAYPIKTVGKRAAEVREGQAWISTYTDGPDYHVEMKLKLDRLAAEAGVHFGVKAYAFVDAQPVAERFWAVEAGLGWIGRNSCVVSRDLGSSFFLGGLFLDAELDGDARETDHCGKCRRCVEACPTQAIDAGRREVNARSCLAYHTIENRGVIPEPILENAGAWIAGCDVCQEVCPWNEHVTRRKRASDRAVEKWPSLPFSFHLTELATWSKEEFRERLGKAAMARMKYPGFLRNLVHAIGHSSLSQEDKLHLLNTIRHRLESIEPGRRVPIEASLNFFFLKIQSIEFKGLC